jgi:beta-lactamase class A
MTSRPPHASRLALLGGLASLPALVTVAALVACGEAPRPAEGPVAASASAAGPTSAASPVDAGPPEAAPPQVPPPAASVALPDTAAGRQLAWVAASFAQPPSEADVTTRFTADFTSHEPVRDLVALFGRLGAQLAPLVIDRVEPGATPDRLTVVAHSSRPGTPPDAKMQIALTVEPSEPHRIAGLTFRRLIDAQPAASWDEVQARMKAVAPSVGFSAAEITGGRCVPLAGLEPKKPLAIGSTFQLYVLDALATQIAAKKRSWSDPIAIDDAKKSLPPGALRSEAAGQIFTARQLAERMIAGSDNTAADHLLAFVGRRAVEETVKAAGNAAAARDVPFLSTRDVFALKLLATPDEQRAYVAADVPRRRKLLEGWEKRDLAKALEAMKSGWREPRMVDSIEWFASAEDLCALVAALKTHADAAATAPVGEMLSANPGLPDDAGAYEYVGFKGGSEPGVANMTWLLQRKRDHAWLVLAVTFNDPGAEIDDKRAVAAAAAARDFLAK